MNDPDEFRLSKFTPTGKYQLLPILEGVDTYRASYRTGEVIVQPVPGELRIPWAARVDKGDFKAVMDRLITAVGHTTVRFIGVETPDGPDLIEDAREIIQPDDARPLYDAVHGFEFESTDDYGDPGVECPTLVGEWVP